MKKVRTSLFFVAVLGVLALGGSAWGVESSESIQGLISHWKFDEGQGSIAYDSAGGNDGTIYGADWTTGIMDGALMFDGVDDYVEVMDDESQQISTNQITLSAWIKLGADVGNTQRRIICKQEHAYISWGLEIFGVGYRGSSGNQLVFHDSDGGTAYRICISPTDLNLDQWYHVAAIDNAGAIEIYINGRLNHSCEDGYGIPSSINTPIIIGTGPSTLDFFFNGKMDEVEIFNRALSPEEIWQLYGGEPSGPVSHWKFDEGQGSIAYDSAGGNDGTVYGAVWTTGQIDGALSFDGVDDYVDVGNDSSLKPPLPVTLSAWIRLSSLGSPQAIVALDDRSIGRYGIGFFVMHENNLQISYADGGSPGPASRRTKVGATALSANTWYHVAAVLRGPRDMGIYINGVDDGGTYSGTGGSLTYSASGHSFIGSDAAVRSYLNGKIDEVAIYNRALSPEEIQQLYQGEFADLVGLEIVGPDEVAENFRAGYKAIAYYDNDSTKDVTNSALWAVEPNTAANIDKNGVLTTKDIVKHWAATILASYTEGDVTVEAEKAIDILAICPTGSALSFDGVDDYVRTANNVFTDAQLASGATLSAWFKTDSTDHSYIADNEGYLTLGVNHIYAAYPNKLCGIVDGGYHRFFSSSDVTDNLWHHAAIVWDGTDTAILYLDGVNVSSGHSGPPTPDRKTRPFTIGTHSTLAAYFNGTIDDVRVYNRALSAEEIQANMHTRLAGDEPNLVGYWDFDEGEGQIVYDLSGNGNDGQLGSTPDVDNSDPAWVKSYAPVGICTLYQIATKAAERALERKLALLKELLATLAEEWTAYEAFEELLESGDYDDLNKGDIATAKQKIHSAIQHEEQVIDALEKSIEKLIDALSALGYEPEPPVPNQPPNVTITKPKDGAVLSPSQTIEIEANAWDVDGSVVKVEFFANGSKIGEDNDGTDGWKTNWYDHPSGTYSLTAKATDNDGAATTSPAVGITVHGAPPPPPPPP